MHCFGSVVVETGDVFATDEGCYVPLFATKSSELTYGRGPNGYFCKDLNGVILPNSAVRVTEVHENSNVEVEYITSDHARGAGFINVVFFEKMMSKMNDSFWRRISAKKLQPMTLFEISDVLQRCAADGLTHCPGANNFEKISINGIYKFVLDDGTAVNTNPCDIRGFDGAGLLHFISNGILPRSIKKLNHSGRKLFTFNAKREYSFREKRFILGFMKDSDYMIFVYRNEIPGHIGDGEILISHNSGFFEFDNKSGRISYIAGENNLIKRLDEILDLARKFGGEIHIIRWHPELLKKPTKSHSENVSQSV
ncbi:MAG: hypothetical protein LBT64_00705 [Puniceicoccales bacterium]|jgi:hypothetical protein|nr:hypothetical protein [Puniceicoccales bacterium]